MAKSVNLPNIRGFRGIKFGMKYTNLRTAVSIVKDFCRNNKKSVISFCAVFVVGLIAGVFITVNAAGGEFEQVARADMELSAVKVFFTSSFMVAIGYAVILVSAAAPSLVFVGLAPFCVLGYYTGKYLCLLAACYGALGIVNLVIIYLPFFFLTMIFMIVAGVKAVTAVGCNKMKNCLFSLLKIYGLNVGVDFVLFVIIGAFAKVIVVGF